MDHDLPGITETWLDSTHDWNVLMDGYVLFREDRQQIKVVELLILWRRAGGMCGALLRARWRTCWEFVVKK